VVDRLDQAGLVVLDHQHIVGVAVGDQVAGMGLLAVERVRGDHPPGQVDLVQQRPEPRDLVGLGVHPPLSQHQPVRPRRQQVRLGAVTPDRAAQRLAIHRDRPSLALLPASQPPTTQSDSSASTRCNARRMVASSGDVYRPVYGLARAPSLASCRGVNSLANSPISVHDLAPDPTAQTATASSDTNECRTPRGSRGSASPSSHGSSPPGPPLTASSLTSTPLSSRLPHVSRVLPATSPNRQPAQSPENAYRPTHDSAGALYHPRPWTQRRTSSAKLLSREPS